MHKKDVCMIIWRQWNISFDFFLSFFSQYFRHILQQNEKSTKHRPFDQTKETVSYKKSNFKNGEFIYFGEYYDVRAWFEPYKGMVYYFLSIFFFFFFSSLITRICILHNDVTSQKGKNREHAQIKHVFYRQNIFSEL